MNGAGNAGPPAPKHGFTNAVVGAFLTSNLSLILVLLATALGLTALSVTPREEDPQIVVPLADVYVDFPGRSAEEVEQLVAAPLERLLYQIDGVEYVYSMSREGSAIVTVRFFVGQDRERSLVKLFKRIDEHRDIIPAGVTGWVVKPVEIDDVPIVTLTLRGAEQNEYTLRRTAEELVERLATVKNISRAYIVGGRPRVVQVYPDIEGMQAYGVSPVELTRAIQAANVTRTAGDFARADQTMRVEVGPAFKDAAELRNLVVGVTGDRPAFLKDVADVIDGPAEASQYVRHGWGPARGFERDEGFPGSLIGPAADSGIATGAARANSTEKPERSLDGTSVPAVTIALAKQKGANAVWVAEDVIRAAKKLKQTVVPDDIEMVITRNYGLTADDKVNELIEALAVAIFIVIALLTLGLGWREALIVAVAVPVVFGLTLMVNLLFGYTINRVTLFALILSLGLLVDDPIVDVENISRHFRLRKKATRRIVLEAVAEIRPPLITATLAVIVSFLPMFFITGMMGPYMRPMALNVPVTMLMSMLVAFTITPWMAFHLLKHRYAGSGTDESLDMHDAESTSDEDDLVSLRRTALYRFFYPLMSPLLRSRRRAWAFLILMGLLTVAASGLAVTRSVPLKMLPFDNKNELLLVLDFDEDTTLERSDAAVREFEEFLANVPEVTDFTSYVGTASPFDFNGLVRHYYLRRGDNVAEIRVNLVGKKSRRQQSHGLGLRLRDELTAIAARHAANLKIVEMPPGPPVLASVVAEVYGRADQSYADLIAAARTVRARLEREPGVVDVDDTIETTKSKFEFVVDKEKAALHGVSVETIAQTLRVALGGATVGALHAAGGERNPLRIIVRLRRAARSRTEDLGRINVKGSDGALTPLAELGHWRESTVDQTIYHKNLERVVYVFAETAGRPPAECVVDVQADATTLLAARNMLAQFRAQTDYYTYDEWLDPPEFFLSGEEASQFSRVNPPGSSGRLSGEAARPLDSRTYLSNGGGIRWWVPDGIRVDFAGEGEWKITLDVFRDLGLAFAAALVGIYILLVAQTGSFIMPLIVMLAIPLTILGIMPGFWALNLIAAGQVGPYADPIFFTATGMIGMIALAGIVTRDSIILVDFIHLSLRRGRSLFDAIMESRVVRLRPILLTAGTAMLSAAPITIDPIFSGLAWSLIFGLLAATVFTLFVIPVTYWLLYEHKPGHGALRPDEMPADS